MPNQLGVESVAETLLFSLSLLIRRIRQTRDDALTMPETSALGLLDREGATTVTALSKTERISAQSIGATLAGLEARGLVRRSPDPDDGRQTVIAITRAGREMLRHRKSARSQQLAKCLSENFTRAEIDRLLTAAPLLARLARCL
jgi:DNA-binding MarR family transcriptional regulator